MAKRIYQVRISLIGFRPQIWRRLLIPSDLLLSDFHKIIQTAMGWTNSHLHQFIKDRTFYAPHMEEEDDFWPRPNRIDYEKITISELLKKEKDKIIYEYDFGDGWRHDIVLQKILPPDDKADYPVCLSGKMNCPPEDCGGVWGYAEMLRILNQPDHEEYESYRKWLGGDFDPEYFDKDEVNEMLREPDFGCPGLMDW